MCVYYVLCCIRSLDLVLNYYKCMDYIVFISPSLLPKSKEIQKDLCRYQLLLRKKMKTHNSLNERKSPIDEVPESAKRSIHCLNKCAFSKLTKGTLQIQYPSSIFLRLRVMKIIFILDVRNGCISGKNRQSFPRTIQH